MFTRITSLLVLFSIFAAQDTLYVESFETDGNGSRYTLSNEFNDGSADHYGRTDGSDISGSFTGISGAYFISAEDLDDNGGDGLAYKYFTTISIDVSAYSSLMFSGLFGGNNGGLDDLDTLSVQYSIDGGTTFNNIINFHNEGGFNNQWREDTDNDGVGDGTALTDSLTEFTANLPDASTILIRIAAHANSASEKFAFDRIAVIGTPASFSVTNLQSSSITTTAATISFSTTEAATATLKYDTNSDLSTADSVTFTSNTDFSTELTGLSAGTTYYYAVRANNGGNTFSDTLSFSTLSETPEFLTGPTAVLIGKDSAYITWSSQIDVVGEVQYGTSTAYGTTIRSSNTTTSDSILITGLSTNQIYHVQVKLVNGIVDSTLSADFTFRTRKNPVSANVFFSEYVEGSSSNKALEIYNGTADTIDIRDYQVLLFGNGSSTSTGSMDFVQEKLLSPGDVYVIVNSSAETTLKNVADTVGGSATFFNGDDVVALVQSESLSGDTVFLDIIGKIGEDPGSNWSRDGVATSEQTLRRKSSVLTGVDANPDSFIVNIEWDSYAQNTYDGLGTHSVDGGASFTVGPTATVNGADSATITFSSDFSSTAIIRYGLSDTYTDSVTIGSAATDFTVGIGGLAPGTGYHFNVTLTRASNSETVTSDDATFTTLADATLFLDGPTVLDEGRDSVKIAWESNNTVTAVVRYGLTDAFGDSVVTVLASTSDTVTISGLTAGTDYHYEVMLVNTGVDTVTSASTTFTTRFNVATNGVFFSEYVEGSSNNKALEIYNGTENTVDLRDYIIAIYGNGGPVNNTMDFPRKTLIEPGDVYVVANSSAWDELKAVADTVGGSATFYNGDDAVALVVAETFLSGADTTYLDIIGKIGEDPGSAWTSGEISTGEQTLRRKASVTTGVNTNPVSFDVALEWESFPQNTFDGLGERITIIPISFAANPVAGSIAENSAVIGFQSSESAIATVRYGLTSEYTDSISVGANTNFSIDLTGLTANTTYHFNVTITRESDGSKATSTDDTFTTTGGASFSMILPELRGQELMDSLRARYIFTNPNSAGYDTQRDSMFATIDNVNDTIILVYSGAKFAWPEGSGRPNVSATNVNTEHTWPQSKGADSGNLRGFDLHHLYPSFEAPNAARGSNPFSELDDDAETTAWWNSNTSTSTKPSVNIDAYSESNSTHFEPREAHKGNVARSMLYFYVMYQHEASVDTAWFRPQIDVMKQWAMLDPVDLREQERNTEVARVQGNINPFIVDTTLIRRIFEQAPPPPPPVEFTAIKDIVDNFNSFDGDTVNITGTVINDFGSLQTSRTNVYISDPMGNAINLNSSTLYNAIKRGDSLTVRGRINSYRKVYQIDPLEAPELVKANAQLPRPIKTTTGAVAVFTYNSSYVEVTGEVSDVSGDLGGGRNITVNDGSGDVTIRVWNSTEVIVDSVDNGATWTFRGGLGSFASGGDTTAQIQPSVQSDLFSGFQVLDVAVTNITTDGAAISFSTPDSATAVIRWGLTSTYTDSMSLAAGINFNAALNGLLSDTTYHFNITATNLPMTDAFTTADATFETLTQAFVFLTEPSAISINDTSAQISWLLSQPANGVIRFGTTSAYGDSVVFNSNVTADTVTISGLTANTEYHFKVDVTSTTTASNIKSTDATFTTTNLGNLPTSGIFFSEYVEGSSNNKALEIYNGTGEVIDLRNYAVGRFTNGSPTITASITWDTETLVQPGEVYVMVNNSSVVDLLNKADLVTSTVNHNGDDAWAILTKVDFDANNAVYIDIFGKLGEDPGSFWDVGGVKTQNQTLRRKNTVLSGVTSNPDTFDPSEQWVQFDNDVFDGIGSHSTIDPNTFAFAVNPNATEISGTTATIHFETTQEATAVLRYGLTATYTDSVTASAGTDFNVMLTGLTAATEYHYNVTVTRVSNSETITSDDATFTTISDEFTAISDILNNFSTYDGQTVNITGVIINDFGNLQTSRTNVYISDTNGNALNLNSSTLYNSLARGDSITVRGTISQFRKVYQIDPEETPTVVKSDVKIPSPISATTGDVAAFTYRSSYVQVTGTVSDVSDDLGGGRNITVNDGSGDVTIRVWNSTGISVDDVTVNNTWTFRGGIGSFASGGDTIAQILPSVQGDIIEGQAIPDDEFVFTHQSFMYLTDLALANRIRFNFTLNLPVQSTPVVRVNGNAQAVSFAEPFYHATYLVSSAQTLSFVVTATDTNGSESQLTSTPVSLQPAGRSELKVGDDFVISVYERAFDRAAMVISYVDDFNASPDEDLISQITRVRINGRTISNDGIELKYELKNTVHNAKHLSYMRYDEFSGRWEKVSTFVDGDHLVTYINESGRYAVAFDETFTTVPDHFALSQNFPNPFNPTTTIRFDIANAGQVQLIIFNSLGQRVRTLVNEFKAVGTHDAIWNGLTDAGQQAPSGLYFYQLVAGQKVFTKKMILMK